MTKDNPTTSKGIVFNIIKLLILFCIYAYFIHLFFIDGVNYLRDLAGNPPI